MMFHVFVIIVFVYESILTSIYLFRYKYIYIYKQYLYMYMLICWFYSFCDCADAGSPFVIVQVLEFLELTLPRVFGTAVKPSRRP